MSPGLLAPTGLGLLLGLRHAFEPDHLAAVSTLATRQGRLGDACRLGLAWAVGHTASLGAVALLIIAGGLHLAARLAYFLAFAVGTMIGMLGVSLSLAAIVRLASGRGARWATALHVAAAVTSVGVGFVLAARVAAGL